MFDFDLSLIVPLGVAHLSYKQCPIRNYEPNGLDDLRLGQYMYNPFACDVALLGLFLSRNLDVSFVLRIDLETS